MRRNTITIIELIIVICVIVVAVVLWNYKKTGSYNISSTTPYSSNYCPQCGNDRLLSGSYTGENKKQIEGKMCYDCRWFSFKCPQCGSKVSAWFESEVDILTPGDYIYVKCKKCRWYSSFFQL